MVAAEAGETPVERTARLLGMQAAACQGLGSPLYAGLLRFAAADLLAGGPTADVLAGHLADPGGAPSRSACSAERMRWP